MRKEISKEQLLPQNFSETVNRYISKAYVIKIESVQCSQHNSITNYIHHHKVINQHNPDKLRAVSVVSPKQNWKINT